MNEDTETDSGRVEGTLSDLSKDKRRPRQNINGGVNPEIPPVKQGKGKE